MRTPLILGLLLIFLGSCANLKDLQYLQDIEQQAVIKNIQETSDKIQINDELLILVSSTDLEASRPFNLQRNSSVNTNLENMTYLVDSNGEIEMPVIGKVHVAGLSRIELQQQLESKISKYLIDAVVNVRIKNYKITVLGEVKQPGTYTVSSEKINIFQALGLAGDLNITALRKNIILVREGKEGTEYAHIDLTSADIISSPYYQLQQNDILVISPNRNRAQASSVNPFYSLAISSISVLTSVISLVVILSK